MDNVIKGPWGQNDDPDIREFTKEETRDIVIQCLVEDLTDALFDGMREAGFDNLGELCYTKDLGLIAESVRSYLLKLQETYHPMQDIADAVFDLEEDGRLFTNDSVNVEFLPHDYC